MKLFTGFSASCLGIIHVLIHFPLYEKLKIHFQRKYEPDSDHLSLKYIFVSSVTAKWTASLFSYPHEVIRARQQDSRVGEHQHNSLWKVITRTYSKQGLFGFYSGFGLNLIRVLPQNCVIFMTYETCSHKLKNLIDKKY